MSGAWSRPPVGRVVPQAELGALGKNLGENNGESRRVCRLEKHPNWIFKEYPKPVPLVGIKRLDQLIKLPQQMSAADKDLVDGHTSWPASRVIDPQQKTIGVLMPLAPPTYSADRQLPSGRSESRVLEVDVLALTEDRQKASKLPPQSLADRISVCASIAAVAALFERHSLVYLDWSYANIFWSLSDHTAYVIDLDGCSFGPRPQIQTHNWADPQVPLGQAGRERVGPLSGSAAHRPLPHRATRYRGRYPDRALRSAHAPGGDQRDRRGARAGAQRRERGRTTVA